MAHKVSKLFQFIEHPIGQEVWQEWTRNGIVREQWKWWDGIEVIYGWSADRKRTLFSFEYLGQTLGMIALYEISGNKGFTIYEVITALHDRFMSDVRVKEMEIEYGHRSKI